MACEICKGTGKVQLLLSSVDCDCVSKAQGDGGAGVRRMLDGFGLTTPELATAQGFSVSFRSPHSNMNVECGTDGPGALAEDARRFVDLVGNGNGIVLVGAQDKERVIAAMESTGWRYLAHSRCFKSPVRLGIICLPQNEEGARGYMCDAVWLAGAVTKSMMDVAMLGLRATGSGAVVTSDGARVVEPQRSGFGVSDERFKDMAARCGLSPAQALLMRKANRGEGLWGRACGRTTAMLVEAACALEDGKAVHLVTASIGSREICDRFESLAARAGVRGRISATRTCSWFGGDKPGWTTFVDHDVRVIVSRHAPEEILTLVLSALEQDERTKGMVYRVSVGDDSIALVELGHECAYTVDHSRFLHPEAASEGKAWAAALVDSLWSEWERDAGQRRREAADAVTDIGSLPMDMREQAKAAVQLGKPLRLSGVPGGLVERLKDQGVAVSCEAQGMPMLPRVQLALGGGDPKGVGEFMRMAENLLPRLHSGMVPERIVFKTEGGQIDGLIERVLEMIFGCEATAE